MDYRNFFLHSLKHFPIVLILILILSRLIPHPPNFTPLIAMSVMSGFFFKEKFFPLFLILISIFISDIFLGFYDSMIFVYLSIMLIIFICRIYFKKLNHKNLIIYSFFGSITFFLISNFGVWLAGNLYQKNINGLAECFIMALPFFKNTVISTFFFSYLAYYADLIANFFYKKKIKI